MSVHYLLFLFSTALSTDLNDISVDTTLSVLNNPYQVKGNINIEQGVTLTIPNGIDIVFMAEYIITVDGIIDGCSNADTTTNTNRGIIYAQPTIIHSQNENRTGGLIFNSAAQGSFCNAKFQGLNAAIRTNSINNALSIDNCEFLNVNVVIKQSSGQKPVFTDSEFHDLYHVISDAPSIFDNCLFQSLEHGVSDATGANSCMYSSQRIEIYRSDITGNGPTFSGTEYCIVGYDNIILVNNTFTNCDNAIHLCSAYGTVTHNTISNSNLAVHIRDFSGSSEVTIQYNNFVNNVMNIEMKNDNCPNCNYNYFGGTTQSQIGAKINDVCDGYSTALVTFWPWYTSMITDASNLPSVDTITTLECTGPATHPEITGNRLNVLYLSGTTSLLSLLNSPYYVINDIVVQQNAIINVENGVEIIFVDEYDFIIRGSINVGCYNLDTSISHQRGLFNPITYVHIHSINNDNNGSITFESTAIDGQFCNVLIETIHSVNGKSFDNCEFRNLNWGVTGNYFNDSHFHDLNYATRNDGMFSNCLFERFVLGVTPYDSYCMMGNANRFELYNSDIIGNGSQNCLSVGDYPKIYNNNITNCNIAIFMCGTQTADIRFNYISNSNIGVRFAIANAGNMPSVMYNNFISITTNIELVGSYDCENCNYNYFGVSSTNQTIIGATINDVCDGLSSALVKWFPYYLNQLDFANIQGQTSVTLGVNDTFICTGPDNYPNIIGNKFNIIYLSETITTLKKSDSPYYVVSDVVIQEGAVMNIPQDIEIIFAGNFDFDVRGTLNMGCNMPQQCDTSSTAVLNGLICIDFIHVHHMRNDSMQIGNFKYKRSTNTYLSFCNVLFNGTNQIAIDTGNGWGQSNMILFDNCEFNNINSVGGGNHLYKDSKFYNFKGGIIN
eukprot:212501_1